MMWVVLEFIKPVNFKNGYLAECRFPVGDSPEVWVHDITKDWQLPLTGIKDIGNPKHKVMDRKTFDKTFKITHIKKTVGYPYAS